MRGQKPPAIPSASVATLNPHPVRVPDPPSTLPEGLARECWDEVVRELLGRNLYGTDIRDMVEAYCVMRARFIEANERVHELGLLVRKKKTGLVKCNPYLAISNSAYDRMVRLAQELGLTVVRRGAATKGTNSPQAGAMKFLRQVGGQ